MTNREKMSAKELVALFFSFYRWGVAAATGGGRDVTAVRPVPKEMVRGFDMAR